MGRRGFGRMAAAVLGVALAAAGMLYGGSLLLGRREPPPVSDWTDWDGTAVFLGDSITEFCDLERFYPGLHTVNRGISGDITAGMLERVQQDVCALAPQIAVVHGGINDIFLGVDDGTVVGNLMDIVAAIRQALPQTQVLVQSVYPVADGADLALTGHIRAINQRLQALAEEKDYAYVDVFSALAAEDGRLTAGYADDGLHPNDAGYAAVQPVLSQAIKAAIARYAYAH